MKGGDDKDNKTEKYSSWISLNNGLGHSEFINMFY